MKNENGDWNKLDKGVKEYLKEWGEVEKEIDTLATRINKLIHAVPPQLFQMAPEVETVFQESPIRPHAIKSYVKQQFRKAGFDFVPVGQPTIADVKIKSVSENIKEACKWLFKCKQKQ